MYTKTDFLTLARNNIKRDGIEKLLAGLEKSDFFSAPASTQFHDSVYGGLCNHSVLVYNELYKECSSKFPLETISIVSLFHDLCKIGYYEESTKNVKDDKTGVWHKEPFYKVNDLFPLGHGEKSLFMINDAMELTADEALAVRWHMGGYEPKENYPYISKAYSTCPLALYLHLADMKATYLTGDR